MTRRGRWVKRPNAAPVYQPGLPGGLEVPYLPQARCAETDPELWFPEPGQSPEPAKAICRDCPERLPCLSWALQANERHGVWGGMTTRERDQIARAARRAA